MRRALRRLNQRAVAVVVDPIQSVKGKVVIDAFRCGTTSSPVFVMSAPLYHSICSACCPRGIQCSLLKH